MMPIVVTPIRNSLLYGDIWCICRCRASQRSLASRAKPNQIKLFSHSRHFNVSNICLLSIPLPTGNIRKNILWVQEEHGFQSRLQDSVNHEWCPTVITCAFAMVSLCCTARIDSFYDLLISELPIMSASRQPAASDPLIFSLCPDSFTFMQWGCLNDIM